MVHKSDVFGMSSVSRFDGSEKVGVQCRVLMNKHFNCLFSLMSFRSFVTI